MTFSCYVALEIVCAHTVIIVTWSYIPGLACDWRGGRTFPRNICPRSVLSSEKHANRNNNCPGKYSLPDRHLPINRSRIAAVKKLFVGLYWWSTNSLSIDRYNLPEYVRFRPLSENLTFVWVFQMATWRSQPVPKSHARWNQNSCLFEIFYCAPKLSQLSLYVEYATYYYYHHHITTTT